VEAVVLAADWVSRAASASTTNDSDGGASEANQDVKILEENPKEAKNDADAGVRSLLNAVAALDGTGVTVSRGDSGSGRGRGNSDSGGHWVRGSGRSRVSTGHGSSEERTCEQGIEEGDNRGGSELHG
jgi:hypothetical protein